MKKTKRIISRANIEERLDNIVMDINRSMPLTSDRLDKKLQLIVDIYGYDITYHVTISEDSNVVFDDESYIKIFTKNFGVKYNKFSLEDKVKNMTRLEQEVIDSIILDLKNTTLTQREIAEKYNVSHTTVVKYKGEFNIKRPTGYSSKSKMPAEIKEAIIDDLKNSSMTQQEIAEKYSVSQAIVSYYNKIYNVERLMR